MNADPIITVSARKHGVGDEAIRHAFNNPLFVHDLDDGLVMIIGASQSGEMLEIGVVVRDEPMIVHAMHARSKFLPRER